MAAIGAMLLHLAPNRSRRVHVVVLNCLAIVVPAALQLAGVIPASYVFEHGTIHIVPAMLALPPLQTHVFMLVANVALVATGCAMLARFRDILTEAEKRLHVTAWQLRQMVPEQVRPASAPPAADTTLELPAAR
jgi:hypothetical protein